MSHKVSVPDEAAKPISKKPHARKIWFGAAGAVALVAVAIAIPKWVPLRSTTLAFPSASILYGIERRSIDSPVAARIVANAQSQIGTQYDASYVPIAYPSGDVPLSQGACTDVIVRALRAADQDLQRLIHEDMKKDRRAYPNTWGANSINANIDHRRVPNQIAFLKRHGRELTKEVNSKTIGEWLPGDIVYWRIGRAGPSGTSKWHTGIVSDGLDANGTPLVIHNGSVCVEDNCLTRWKIIGHFRFP